MTGLPEMLGHLDDCLDNARRNKYRSSDRAMHIVVSADKPDPTALLGCTGKVARTFDDGRRLVTFTTKQVRAMRRYVADALAAEAAAPTVTHLVVDDPAARGG